MAPQVSTEVRQPSPRPAASTPRLSRRLPWWAALAAIAAILVILAALAVVVVTVHV